MEENIRILFYQWHSFMNRGVERALSQMQIAYDVFFYQQSHWEKDDGIVEQFEQKLKEHAYTLVLSINFAPMVSNVCQARNLLYISWVYDSPIHIRDLTPLKNHCNKIFFFDKNDAETYQKQGIAAYHMPLAADIDAFGGDKKVMEYSTDISLVGSLYHTEYGGFYQFLTTYHRGYLDGILKAQMKVYGGYFLGELLDEKLLSDINAHFLKISGEDTPILKRQLEYMMACEITGRERYLALALLSKHFKVNLYAPKTDERLKNVSYKGYVNYYAEMPRVFRQSRINLNISLKSIQSGVPLRVFDVLGSGGFLLTNFQSDMTELFEIGRDFVVYESIEDLYEKADYYLRHETERKQIARQGYETVAKYYTFRQQMEKILKEALR